MLIIIGKISCCMVNTELTKGTKQKEKKERQRQSTTYLVDGMSVCRQTFRFLHGGYAIYH
jgi:hypothetical protein